jgi:hypothetical protein
MTDVGALLDAVGPYLSAVVRAYGARVLEQVKQEAPDAAADATVGLGKRLLARLLRRPESRPEVAAAVVDLAADPDDADLAAVVRVQVRKALTADGELAQQWAQLLADAGVPVGKYTVTVHDSQGVQVGDSNQQTNTFGAPNWP